MKATAAALERLPTAVFVDLKTRCAEPQRHYHVWRHVEALLEWWEGRLDALGDPEAVFLAILFHDAVYDPTRADNESRSADLLVKAMLPQTVPATRDRAVRMIHATAGHEMPKDLPSEDAIDLAEFLDMDLSILGAPARVFDAYEDAIRAEYAFVPEALYRVARARILTDFLERPRLYFSQWGRAQFEKRARANISRSIAALA